MTFAEARELLDVLEKLKPEANLRLTLSYDKEVHQEIRKDYLAVIERTAWTPQEITVSDKK